MILVIHYGGFLIFKPKTNALYCGIWGWAGRAVNSFNREKFNLLGILNETRGRDSCGVAVDGEIYHGTDENKIYRDFLANKSYDNPMTVPIVLGHTRAKSVGTIDPANAHPFGFGESQITLPGSYAFIGMHNGTLYNYEALAKKYKVNPEAQELQNNKYVTRKKIDSEILLEIIFTSKKFKVLSQYNGLAALAFFNVDEPDYLYLYHGASVEELLSNKKTIYVERPLYVYQEHKNSLYFSSQKEGLISIGGTDDTILDLPTNVVYKIKHGNLKTAKKFEISRRNMQHKKLLVYDVKKLNEKATKENKKYETIDESLVNAYVSTITNTTGRGGQNNSTPFQSKNKSSMGCRVGSSYNIHNDKRDIPQNKAIYTQKLRYLRNGHLCNGIYTWIPTRGFYYLADDLKFAEARLYDLCNKEFIKGDDFKYNDDPLKDGQEIFIPFPNGIGFKKEIINPNLYFHYFFEGIRLRSYSDYIRAFELRKNKVPIGIEALSAIAAHPITDIDNPSKDDKKQAIFLDNVLYSGNFAMLGSHKIYHIEKGNCIYWSTIDSSAHRTPYSNLELVIKELETNEDEIIKQEGTPQLPMLFPGRDVKNGKLIPINSLGEIEEILFQEDDPNPDEVEILIDELFMPVFEKFQRGREQLEPYKFSPKGQEALELMGKFMKDSTKLLEVEVTE